MLQFSRKPRIPKKNGEKKLKDVIERQSSHGLGIGKLFRCKILAVGRLQFRNGTIKLSIKIIQREFCELDLKK